MTRADRLVRWMTTASVVLLAAIAAVISYRHMRILVLRHGESEWTAALLPLSVDGMIAASSLALLADSRQGRRGGLLPWTLLVIGSAASLAANVAVAEPTVVGRLIAAWPSFALIGSYELLMRQIRTSVGRIKSAAGHETSQRAAPAEPSPEQSHRVPADGPGSEDVQIVSLSGAPAPRNGQAAGASAVAVARPLSRRRQRADIRRRAWDWARSNRGPHGELPPGDAIAKEFGRSARWGRLVKQAGQGGNL